MVYGRVWTGDSARPWAGAVAVAGDTISAVGDSAEIAALAGPATKVLSNGAALVTPGFMDGHLHFLDGGFQLASVDLRPANTPAEFIARLAAFATERKPGEWIIGGDWDHERWPGRAAAPPGVDRLGHARTTRCSSTGSTATWRWPTARRCARRRSTAGRPRTSPAASSSAIPEPASRPAS